MRLIPLYAALIWLISGSHISSRDIVKPNYVPYCTTRDKCKPACSCQVAPNCVVLDLDDITRKNILNYHNQIRDIQSAGEPIPGGMTMLQYDDNLEQISKCWAARCEDEYSECFITSKFNETSQAAVQITLQAGSDPKISLLMQMMNSWLGQAKVISAETLSDMPAGDDGEKIHNFAQLLSDRILYLGCAWSRNEQVLTFVCTYGPRGPIQGEPIYKIGKLCTLCPENYACDYVKPFSRLCKASHIKTTTVHTPPPPPPIAPEPAATAPPEPPPKPPQTTTELITPPPTPPPFQNQPVIIPKALPPPTIPTAVTCPAIPMASPPLLPPREPPSPLPMCPQQPPVQPPEPAPQPISQVSPAEPPILPQAPPEPTQAPTYPQAPPILPETPPSGSSQGAMFQPSPPALPPKVPPSGITPQGTMYKPPPMPPKIPPRTPSMVAQSIYSVLQQQPQSSQRFSGGGPPRLPQSQNTGYLMRERMIEATPLLPPEPATFDGVYSLPQIPAINTQPQTYFPPEPPPLPHSFNTPPPPPRVPPYHPQTPPQLPPPQTFVNSPPTLPQPQSEPVTKPALLPRVPMDPFIRPPYLPQLPLEPVPRPPLLPRIPHQDFPHQFVQPLPPPRLPPNLDLGQG